MASNPGPDPSDLFSSREQSEPVRLLRRVLFGADPFGVLALDVLPDESKGDDIVLGHLLPLGTLLASLDSSVDGGGAKFVR